MYTNLVSYAPPRPPWHGEVDVNGRKGGQAKEYTNLVSYALSAGVEAGYGDACA